MIDRSSSSTFIIASTFITAVLTNAMIMPDDADGGAHIVGFLWPRSLEEVLYYSVLLGTTLYLIPSESSCLKKYK